MKITLITTSCIYLLTLQVCIAQITPNDLVGTWGLVGFDLKPQNKSGTLTEAEKMTLTTMQNALKEQPQFMKLTFQGDGDFSSEPNTFVKETNTTWQLKGNVVEIRGKKKVLDKYYARIAFNGMLELKAIKSKIAIPILTWQKN